MTGRWLRNLGLSSLLTIAAASGVFPGCAEDESSLFIYAFKELSTPPACSLDNTPTGPFLTGGSLDVLRRNSYIAFPLVANQLVQRGDPQSLRTETSHIEINQAQVTIEDVSGTTLTSYTVPVTGISPVGSGNTAGYGFVSVIMIDPTTGAALAKELSGAGVGAQKLVVSKLKLFGRTTGGTDISSNEVSFPITVCYDCLTQYLGGAGKCNPGADATQVDATCLPGQDSVSSCCAYTVCNSP